MPRGVGADARCDQSTAGRDESPTRSVLAPARVDEPSNEVARGPLVAGDCRPVARPRASVASPLGTAVEHA